MCNVHVHAYMQNANAYYIDTWTIVKAVNTRQYIFNLVNDLTWNELDFVRIRG